MMGIGAGNGSCCKVSEMVEKEVHKEVCGECKVKMVTGVKC
jgi:hypothetical protein